MDKFLEIVLPDDSPSCSPKTPIATLAFIDLETTGLPSVVGKKNVQITEIAIVAVDRTDFEQDDALRVVNKINIFVRPRAEVSFGAFRVTGLYNDVLERQQPFDDSIPKMLDLFFKRLRSPVCLLAHNGKLFDFPILQAELKRLGCSLPEDVTCVDTLVAFRSLGVVRPNNEHKTTMNDQFPPGVPVNGDVQSEANLIDPVDAYHNAEYLLTTGIEDFQHILVSEPSETGNDDDLITVLNNGRISPGVNVKTPTKGHNNGKHSVAKHRKKVRPQQVNNFLPCKRQLFNADEMGKNDHHVHAPKSSTHSDNVRKKGPGFSLEKLYVHYFGEAPPKAHHADSDCINLCRITQHVSDSLLPWLDENQEFFSEQPSMW